MANTTPLTSLQMRIFDLIEQKRISDTEDNQSSELWENTCDHDSAIPWHLKSGDELSKEEEAELAAIHERFKGYRIEINARYDAKYKELQDEFTLNKDLLCAKFLVEHPDFEERFTLQAALVAADEAVSDASHRLCDALVAESEGVALAPEVKAALELAVADADAAYESALAAKAAYEHAAAASVSTPAKASAATLDVPPEVRPKEAAGSVSSNADNVVKHLEFVNLD